MNKDILVITGAAGFIGSCALSFFKNKGNYQLVIVDDFTRPSKERNYEHHEVAGQIDRNEFASWLTANQDKVSAVLHLGARTDTTEKDTAIFDRLNLHYSQAIFKICTTHQIPLIYASSAATYGNGENGYADTLDPAILSPLNPYGDSKNDFDAWVLQQPQRPPFWAGLKFFNVYGPNEYHIGRMASVILHTFRQINKTGAMKLFRSHRPDFEDGQQSRDFIYVKDLLSIFEFLLEKQPTSGLYNIGTGKARSFYDLAANVFVALGLEPKISFIDTPADIRDTYQYFTEADMNTLKSAGYDRPFYSLEEGIMDYVQQYLQHDRIY